MLVQDQLQRVFLLGPATGRDGDAVRTVQGVVVVADAELAARQGAAAIVGFPGGQARRMGPTPHGFVARRIVDLVHGLRPRAAGPRALQGDPLEAVAAHKRMQFAILIAPVLAPVFDHHGSGDRAVVQREVHHDNVLQADQIRPIGDQVHALGAPALVGAARGVSRGEPHGFNKIEAGAVIASHGQNRPAIALLSGQARRLQGAKRAADLRIQGHPRPAGAAPARFHCRRVGEHPGKGVLARRRALQRG